MAEPGVFAQNARNDVIESTNGTNQRITTNLQIRTFVTIRRFA